MIRALDPCRRRPDDLRRSSVFPRALVPGIVVILALLGGPDEVSADGSTEPAFPPRIQVVVDEEPRVLELTGRTMRRKFFISIYRMAHYMENPPVGTPEEVTAAVLDDERAKRIVMEFVREVPHRKILESLREGLAKNTTPRDSVGIEDDVDRFCTAIDRAASEGDRFEIQWLPGGAVTAHFQGEAVFETEDRIFARALWSIWFGDHSVVDPVQLISRFVPGS